MRSDLLERAPWTALLAAACWSALAFYFSTAANDITALAWIAPVPILAFVFARGAAAREDRQGPPQGRMRVGAAAFLGAAGGNLAWVALYHGILPLPALVGLLLLLAAAFAAVVLLTDLVAARAGSLAAVFAFPVFWVVVEFALTRLSPHGSMGSVAYSQSALLPLVQLGSWTGLAGITFVVCLSAAGVAALLGDRRHGLRWELLAAPVLVLVFVFILGQWRMASTPPAGRALVGLASVDGAMRQFDTTQRDEALRVVSAYVDAAGSLAAHGAEAVVLPEKMVGVAPSYEDEVSRLLSAVAEREEIMLVAGLNRIGQGQRRNSAAIYGHGRRVLEYDKQHLVPGFEDGYRRGAAPGLYRAPGGMVGVAICKDMDFPSVGRPYGMAGAGLVFVPAWDFERDGRLHARMAVMRGVEGGFSVARAAANGLLTGSDYFGRVIAERESRSAPQALLLAELPLGSGLTFYARYGDWFAWLCVTAAAALVVLALSRPGTSRSGPRS